MSFTEYCIQQHGRRKTYQLCMDVSEKGREVLAEWKNEWLKEIGGAAEYEEFAKLPFTYNNSKPEEGYPYVVKGKMANWYFATEDIRNLGYETLVEDYVKITPLADLDFAEAQEVLKEYIAEEVPAVHIFTAYYENTSFGGIYNSVSDILYLYNEQTIFAHLLHEYVHYLTLGMGKLFPALPGEWGLIEGATDEVSHFECENRMEKQYREEAMTDGSIAWAKEIGAWDGNLDEIKIPELYYYWANRFYSREIEGEYGTVSLTIMTQPEKITLSSLSYEAAASMVHYLIELYGRDRVFECCTNNDKLEELCGKSFDEIYEEWGQWNEQKCLEMKKLLH